MSAPSRKPARRLSDDKALFNSLIDLTREATGLLRQRVFHDYWLIRGLSGVAAAIPEGGRFRELLTERDIRRGRTEETRPIQGVWAFGGGTCLSSAWKISPRWSEDIDAGVFMHPKASGSAFHDIRRQVTEMVEDFVGVPGQTSGSSSINHTEFTIYERLKVKVDHVRENLSPELIVRSSSVAGLIARHVDEPDALCEQFPELGGFTLPVIHPAYIAVNKLDALHRRAATERWDALRGRVRDVYDLYHIAKLPAHADMCRSNIADWWHHTNRGTGPMVDRPENGYGTSPIFVPGSVAYEVLNDAYSTRIEEIAIGRPPPFDEVIAAARTLDLP